MQKSINYRKAFQHINGLKSYTLIIDWQRPGSGMFQACLDDHPQILQLPGIVRFYQFWKKNYKNKNLSKLLNLFINDNQFSSLFNSKIQKYERWDQLGPKRNKYFKIEKKIFIKHAKNLIKDEELNIKNFFLSVLGSYFISRKKNLFKTKIIFIHLHRYYEIIDQEKIFANSNYILITRDLRNGLASYMSSREKNFLNSFESLHVCIQSYARVFDLTNKDHFPFSLLTKYKLKKKIDNLRIVSYEKLNQSPKKTFRSLSRYLGIKYLEKIFSSTTINGLIWWGDKGTKRLLTGINQNWATRKKWKDEYSKLDLLMFDLLYEKQMESLNQKKTFSRIYVLIALLLFPILILVPMKYELKNLAINLKKQKKIKNYFYIVLKFFYFYLKRVKTYLEAIIIKFKLDKKSFKII